MSRGNDMQRDDTEEPPTKILRLRSRTSEPVKRKPKLRKCKKAVGDNSCLNICHLPTEVLEKIVGNINIWHHNRIRATCRRMRDVNTSFVMHEFQKAASKHFSRDPRSEASASLRIIQQATEVYVRSGFESTFCGCILPMLRSSYRDPFCPHSSQVKMFLVHFYDMVTELMGGETSSQRWRLLYTITLMRLIKVSTIAEELDEFPKAFDKSIISSTGLPLHWRIVVELKGPWLGKLWSSKGHTQHQSRHRCNLLVILSEMLMANITEKGFKHVWECPSEMYVFGNDTSNSTHLPTTLFTFTVYGSRKICNMFRSCLEDDPDQFQWPSKWPNDQFTVNLDIVCKEAMKWGCSKSQHIEFGPFSETEYGEGDEEEEN